MRFTVHYWDVMARVVVTEGNITNMKVTIISTESSLLKGEKS